MPRVMLLLLLLLLSCLILCCPLLLLPSIFPSMRVFSSESVLHIRWPKYWSFSAFAVPQPHWVCPRSRRV